MLSLRTLARSVARAAPRSASSYTSKAISNRAIQTTLRTTPLRISQQTAAAAFSTSARRYDDISQELGAKLASELALEQANTEASADSDSNVKNFLAENDFWVLNDPEGDQDVTMSRKYDDEVITVGFSIADFNTSSMMDEADDVFGDEEDELEPAGPDGNVAINQGKAGSGNVKVAPQDSVAPADQEGMEEDEEYDPESQQAFPANVNVVIQRPGKGALRANLVANDGSWTINSVTQLPESIASSQSVQELLRPTPDSPLYAGPPFAQLDEEVQMLIEQYLEARGVDTRLATFVPDYIDVKEQREYQAWLGRVKDFVD